MAGLSDMFGDSWEDPKSQAIMALAGGLMGGDWKSGLMGYSKVMSGAGDAKMASDIKKAQLLKFANDIEMDKGKLALDQGKAKRTGDFESILMQMMKGDTTATPDMPVTGLQSADGVANVGKRTDPFAGVDRTALMLDYMQNGGKNMGEWVNKRTAPDMQVTNGYAYDKNRLGAGFMPSLTTSTDGKSLMQRIGADGLPVSSVPQGSLEAFSAYQNAGEASKAGYKLEKVTLPGGLEVMMTADQLINMTKGQQPQRPSSLGQKTAPTAPMPRAAGSEANTIAANMGGLGGLPTTARGSNVSLRSTPQEMDKPRILQDAYNEATERFTMAQKAGDVANMQRAKSDIDGIQRELGGARPQSLAPNQAPQSAPSFGLQLQSRSEQERTSAENEAYKAALIKNSEANAKNVAPAMMEELFKADDSARAGKSVIKTLDEALKLNNDAYSGYGANTRATIVSNLPFESKSANATVKLDNMLKGQALDSMKAIFGSNPTEGERTILLEIQASPDKTPAQRQDIMERAKEAAASRIKFNEEKAKAIRSGTYLNEPLNNDKQKPKSLQDYGYKSNNDVIRDAQNTIMRNPQSKAEVERRLKAMGLSLGGQ